MKLSAPSRTSNTSGTDPGVRALASHARPRALLAVARRLGESQRVVVLPQCLSSQVRRRWPMRVGVAARRAHPTYDPPVLRAGYATRWAAAAAAVS